MSTTTMQRPAGPAARLAPVTSIFDAPRAAAAPRTVVASSSAVRGSRGAAASPSNTAPSNTAVSNAAVSYTASANTAPSHTAPSRVRLTARGRRALALLVALPIIAIGGFLVWSGGSATATQTTVTAEHTYVTVYPGDTLWSIAESVAPGEDPRDVIVEIQQLNALQGGIVPGQQLAIPLQYTR